MKECSVHVADLANSSSISDNDAHSTKPEYEVADVLRLHLGDYLEENGANTDQWKAINAILKCRTSDLGYHKIGCDTCDYEKIEYNSCRNRHCPKCQGALRFKWVEARLKDLLPVSYYHVVFTMPHKLNSLALHNKAIIYDLFMKATGQTLYEFALDPKYLGAKIGFVGLLHTWGQLLPLHVHMHYIVPAGGLSIDGSGWKNLPYRKKFLFPSKAMSRRVRNIFSKMLQEKYDKGELLFPDDLSHLKNPTKFKRYLNKVAWSHWYNYVKKPFSNPENVLKYIGRYSHRIAISNPRILDISDGHVTFSYKKYKDGTATMSTTRITGVEFIRRFLLHILPKGFKKIRYFGTLSSGLKRKSIELARELLGVCQEQLEQVESYYNDLLEQRKKCPNCETGTIYLVEKIDPRIPHLRPG